MIVVAGNISIVVVQHFARGRTKAIPGGLTASIFPGRTFYLIRGGCYTPKEVFGKLCHVISLSFISFLISVRLYFIYHKIRSNSKLEKTPILIIASTIIPSYPSQPRPTP